MDINIQSPGTAAFFVNNLPGTAILVICSKPSFDRTLGMNTVIDIRAAANSNIVFAVKIQGIIILC